MKGEFLSVHVRAFYTKYRDCQVLGCILFMTDMKKQDERFELRISSDLLLKIKQKSKGLIPLSKIIKRLLEKWVNNEVELD